MIDWHEFWSATSVITVVGWILGVVGIVGFLVKGWPRIRAAVRLIDSLAELPTFMVDTKADVTRMRKQLENSHVTNMRDDITEAVEGIARVELGVRGLYVRMDAAEASDLELRADLEQTRDRHPERPNTP